MARFLESFLIWVLLLGGTIWRINADLQRLPGSLSVISLFPSAVELNKASELSIIFGGEFNEFTVTCALHMFIRTAGPELVDELGLPMDR